MAHAPLFAQGARTPRSFGLSIGVVLGACGGWLMWRHSVAPAGGVALIAVVLIVCALAYPALLERPSEYWWRLSDVISAVASRVLLSVIFALAFVPISIAWRILRKDPLQRRREQWNGWSRYPARYRAPTHYQRMF